MAQVQRQPHHSFSLQHGKEWGTAGPSDGGVLYRGGPSSGDVMPHVSGPTRPGQDQSVSQNIWPIPSGSAIVLKLEALA